MPCCAMALLGSILAFVITLGDEGAQRMLCPRLSSLQAIPVLLTLRPGPFCMHWIYKECSGYFLTKYLGDLDHYEFLFIIV